MPDLRRQGRLRGTRWRCLSPVQQRVLRPDAALPAVEVPVTAPDLLAAIRRLTRLNVDDVSDDDLNKIGRAHV